MKLLHAVNDREGRGFSENERFEAAAAARVNLVEAAMTLIEAQEELEAEGEEAVASLRFEAERAKEDLSK